MMRLVLCFANCKFFSADCKFQSLFRCSRNQVLPIVQYMLAVVQVAMKMRCGALLVNSEGSWRFDFGNKRASCIFFNLRCATSKTKVTPS